MERPYTVRRRSGNFSLSGYWTTLIWTHDCEKRGKTLEFLLFIKDVFYTSMHPTLKAYRDYILSIYFTWIFLLLYLKSFIVYSHLLVLRYACKSIGWDALQSQIIWQLSVKNGRKNISGYAQANCVRHSNFTVVTLLTKTLLAGSIGRDHKENWTTCLQYYCPPIAV